MLGPRGRVATKSQLSLRDMQRHIVLRNILFDSDIKEVGTRGRELFLFIRALEENEESTSSSRHGWEERQRPAAQALPRTVGPRRSHGPRWACTLITDVNCVYVLSFTNM